MSVYTTENRIKLYAALVKRVGIFDINKWHLAKSETDPLKCPVVPLGINKKNLDIIYSDIFDEIVPRYFKVKQPKSAKALQQQVAWCMTIQESNTPDHYTKQRSNRLAAYLSGFMSMTDICTLEQLADQNKMLQ